MKKKIKDLQSEDIYNLCKQHQNCEECSLFKVFPWLGFCSAIPAFVKIIGDSNKEIEIPEEVDDGKKY